MQSPNWNMEQLLLDRLQEIETREFRGSEEHEVPPSCSSLDGPARRSGSEDVARTQQNKTISQLKIQCLISAPFCTSGLIQGRTKSRLGESRTPD
jgi:hypothetical protein